ncbi:50S ribosomal protein L19 [bacterium]|nr:50S ribosomal protein L19 [bacterium]
MSVISKIEQENMKKKVPEFNVGDTVKVYTKIVEGERERIQVFTGTVIARKGKDANEMFTVRRVVYGEGVERVFYVHSPRVENVEVTRRGKVRRAKLYYLKNKVGKSARVKEKKR